VKRTRLLVVILLLLALVALVGCFSPVDPDPEPEPEPDLVAPIVVSVQPAAGSLHNLINAVVTILFSEEVDSATVTADTIVVSDSFGNVVSGTLAPGLETTFSPDPPLRFGHTYSVSVTSGVADPAGNGLAAEISSSFSTRAVPVAGGGWHALAVAADGSVWAWGANLSGSLGDGTFDPSTTPIQVVGVGGTGLFTDAVAVAGANEHSLALKSDGTVWGWGIGSSGELGDGMGADSSTPVQVVGEGGIGVLPDIVAISAEYYQSFALQSDGTVWAWGWNGEDQIGDIGANRTETPEQVFTDAIAISSGSYHTLALKNDGTVWAWGEDSYGELGDGTVGGGSNIVPTQVVGPSGTGFLTDIVAVDAGEYISSAIRSDGTVWTWGGDYYEQLGDGVGNINQPSPVQVLGPGGSGVLIGIVQVDAAYDHVVGLKDDGTVWSWGSQYYGEIGNGITSSAGASSPVQAVGTGGTGLLTGVAGVATSDYHSSFAVLSDGTVRGWGWNDSGELGTDTVETASSGEVVSSVPVQISTLDVIP